jgi:glycosyltransferase involved in cell wall biosynthesis
MKILVVTNLYPPHHVGGYELGCRDVVEQLRARGHAVRVLTSTFRLRENAGAETDVERSLHFITDDAGPAHDKRAECRKLAQAVKNFSPDIIYFWNQAGLCLWLPVAARWRGWRTAFFLSDTNFISWRVGAWLARFAAVKSRGSGRESAHSSAQKNLSRLTSAATTKFVRAIFGGTFLVRGWPVIQNRPCHFASEFLRTLAEKNGIRVARENSVVAHWGIELENFSAAPRARWPGRRLLYAGQLIPQKGVHTAIAALGLLAREKEFAELTLTIAGGGLHPDYEKQLREQAAQPGLAGRVSFLGKVPRTELPKIYAAHDVLIFPSEWDEPFAITPLEAITSGLAVVGTTTGGSGELFRDRATAMTFRAGDAADCARALRELCDDRELFEKICANAQREVKTKHALAAMADKIENSLRGICGE